MDIAIRPIREEEFDAFVDADSVGFGYTPDPLETRRTLEFMEFDRTLAVFADDDLVGTTCIFSFEMAVPGGSLPAAGVSWVSVKPTHTRRGILRAMMARQLSDVRDRGEAFATLWASESLIYGRFGYGLAAQDAALRLERRHGNLEFAPQAEGTTKLVQRDEALARWPELYERVRVARPGWLSRHPAWWEHRLLPDKRPDGGQRLMLAQYEQGGTVRGFARYRWKMDWDASSRAEVPVQVDEVVAETLEAYAALWQLVLKTDLATHVHARRSSPDEPLYYMLADPRRLERRLYDSLWIRIVDVERALEGRAYARDGAVTFAVDDEFCDWTEGVYRLDATGGQPRCTRTSDTPHLRLDIRDLGAVYLGGTRLATLAQAGRVTGDPKAIALADQMFAWQPLPYCPEMF